MLSGRDCGRAVGSLRVRAKQLGQLLKLPMRSYWLAVVAGGFLATFESAAPDPVAKPTEAPLKAEFVRVKTKDGITLAGALRTPPAGKPKVGIAMTHGGNTEFPIMADWVRADPMPRTVPPTQELLQKAKMNLHYVFFPDTRNGKTDFEAHRFAGREAEVRKIALEWLKKHDLGP